MLSYSCVQKLPYPVRRQSLVHKARIPATSVHISTVPGLPTVHFLVQVLITGNIHTACNHKQAWKHNYTLWFSFLTWPGCQENRKTQRHCSRRWHQLLATGLPGCKCRNRSPELCRPYCTCPLLDSAVHRKSCSSPPQPALGHVNTHIPVEDGYKYLICFS